MDKSPPLSITELCGMLGYGGETPGHERYHRKLAKATNAHRTNARKAGRLVEDPDALENARELALSFCKNFQRYFPDTQESRAQGWCILPDDQDQIAQVLEEIFLHQINNAIERRLNVKGGKKSRVIGSPTGLTSNDDMNDVNRNDNRITESRHATSRFGNRYDTSAAEDGDVTRNLDAPDERSDSDSESPHQHSRSRSENLVTSNLKFGASDNSQIRAILSMDENLEKIEKLRLKVQENVDEMMRWAYPRVPHLSSYEDMDISQQWQDDEEWQESNPKVAWLFKGGRESRWPDDSKSLALRYIHENRLYTFRPTKEELVGMRESLTDHIRLKCNPMQLLTIERKCGNFIVECNNEWFNTEYRVLDMDNRKKLKRGKALDAGFRAARQAWEDQRIGRRNIYDVPEDDPALGSIRRRLSAPFQAPPAKKQKHATRDVLRVGKLPILSSFVTPTEGSRLATNADTASSGGMEVSKHTDLRVPSPLRPRTDGLSSETNELNESVFRGWYPSAPKITAPLAVMEPVSPAPLPEIKQEHIVLHQSSPVADDNSLYESSPIHRAASESFISCPSHSELPSRNMHKEGSPRAIGVTAITEPPRPETSSKISRQQIFSNSGQIITTPPSNRLINPQNPRNGRVHSLQTPPHNTTELFFPTPKYEDTETSKVAVILQNIDGSMAFETPIEFHDLIGRNLEDFFVLFSSRTHFPLQDLSVLTFIVVFASFTKIIIRRSDSEQRWKVLKRRIGNLFIDAKSEDPSETDFDVWVKSGDRTSILKASETF